MVEYIDIIKRLIQYRHNHQITQTQLAEIFSITQCKVNKLEANKYRISYYVLLQLHIKTHLDIDFLITGKLTKNTTFHTLEKNLSSIPSAKYRYIDLILFSLNNFYGQISIHDNRLEYLNNLQCLIRYSFLSGSKQKNDCWINIRNTFDLTQVQMAKIMDIDIKSTGR